MRELRGRFLCLPSPSNVKSEEANILFVKEYRFHALLVIIVKQSFVGSILYDYPFRCLAIVGEVIANCNVASRSNQPLLLLYDDASELR
jgi:hypothetical protein